ncbi:MAG: hypothetical protein ACE5LB_08180, partial [Acidiferrobacterales bacterium]
RSQDLHLGFHATLALASAEFQDRKRTVAQELSLDLESRFDQQSLDLNNISALLRASAASARLTGKITDLTYFNGEIPKKLGVRIRAGTGHVDGQLTTAAGKSNAGGAFKVKGDEVRAEFNDLAVAGDIELASDVRYGPAAKGERKTGLVVLKEGPLTIPKASFRLTRGEVLLGEGRAVQELAIAVDSTFDRLVLGKRIGPKALRAVSASVRVSGRWPGLQFLNGYFRKAPWVDLNGSGALTADVRVERGVLVPGSRLDVDADVILANFMDYRVLGSGKVQGRVSRTGGGSVSEVTIRLEDFEFARQGFDQPYIFGTGFTITGTAAELDLSDPFTDLKVAVRLPESKIPNFAVYNSYIPPEACIFIHQGSGRIRSELDFDAKQQTAKGRISFNADKVIAQFTNVTLAGDLKVDARLRNGDVESRTFDMGGTKVELRNTYVGAGKLGTDNSWWAQFELPKGKAQFTTPAQLDAKIQMSLRDSRPLVVFLAEKKGVVRWFKNLLTVEDIRARADFKMEGKAVEVTDLEMTGDRFEVLGELDIFARRFAGVFYARLRDLSVAVELTEQKKKWKLSKSKPWFEKRRQVYRAHKWFAEQNGTQLALAPEPDVVVTKAKRKKSAKTGCWQ